MPFKTCITECTTPKCRPLHERVQNAIQSAVKQGYSGKTGYPDVYMSGHSLGGVCAEKLVRALEDDDEAKFESLVVMGSYVDN